MHHVVLLPDDLGGPGVADEAGHPGNALGILAVHPVPEALVDLHLVDVAAGILAGEPVELGAPFGGDAVAVVGRVVATHEDGEGQVPEPQQRGLVGVAGHHGGRGEPVGHARSQLPDPIAAGGVPHQVHPVRAHAPDGDIIVDEALEHRVDVALVPEVPGVGRGAGSHVESLGGLIQADLVLPLLVVHLLGRAAAAMHGDPQAPLPGRRLAEFLLQPTEGLALEGQFLLLEFRGALGHQLGHAVGRDHGQHTLGLCLGQGPRQQLGVGRAPVGRQVEPLAHGVHRGRGRAQLGPAGVDRGVAPVQRAEGHFTHLGAHRESQPSLGPRSEAEAGHVVEVGRARLGVGQGAGSADAVEHTDLGREARAPGAVPQSDTERCDLDRGRIGLGIACGHVDGRDRGALAGPDHRERQPLALPRGGIDGVTWFVDPGLRGVADEPSPIQPGRVVFVSPREMPVTVPDLHPGVVAPLVGPHRGAHGAGRDAHRAAGLDQDDGEPRAGGFSQGLGLLEALVGALASGVVVDVHELEELAVQGLGRLAGGAGVLHQVAGHRHQFRPPRVPGLVEDGIGQHVVQEQGLGHLLGPRELLPGPESQVEVLPQELVAQILPVGLGHVFSQEPGRGFARSPMEFLGRPEEFGDRRRHGGPPQREEQRQDTNRRHTATLQQLAGPGQRTSHGRGVSRRTDPQAGSRVVSPKARQNFLLA